MFVVTWLEKWSDANITKKDDLLVGEIPRTPMSKMVVGPDVCGHNGGGSQYILELPKLYVRPHVIEHLRMTIKMSSSCPYPRGCIGDEQ